MGYKVKILQGDWENVKITPKSVVNIRDSSSSKKKQIRGQSTSKLPKTVDHNDKNK